MRFSKRSSVLVFGLLLGTLCPARAHAGTDEAIAIEAPVAYLTPVAADAELPDDPGSVAGSVAGSMAGSVAGSVAASGDQQQVQQGSGSAATGAAVAADPLSQGRQTKRILWVVPNFRAVSADQHLPPQTVKDKFKTAMLDSFDYSSFIFVGGQAGVAMANKSYPEFHQGAAGYGRYYWHTLADAINENTFVEFILPAALHQDTRFYTLGNGNFGKRLGYAFTRIVITRSDSGKETFNASEILGAGAFAGVANLYYPSQERTVTKSYQRWITNLAIDGVTFAFKEVWPDLNNAVFHQKD